MITRQTISRSAIKTCLDQASLQGVATRPHIYFLLPYRTNKVAKLVLGLKYSYQPRLWQLLGDKLAELLPALLAENYPLANNWTVTPVPLSVPGRLKRRFNANTHIAKAAAKHGDYLSYQNIFFNRGGKRQGDCQSRTERINNAAAKFCLLPLTKIAGKNFIVLDDVITTGATANTLRQLLLEAGARNVIVVALAH